MVCVGVTVTLVTRIVAQDATSAPSGPDPGNWLRLAWRITGDGVVSAQTVYPPVLPALLRGELAVLEPMVALKALGLVTSVLLVVPCYLLLRERLAPWGAACLALAALGAGYQQEVYAWGGYPQLLGTAFLLFAVYGLGCWLESGRQSHLLWSAVFVSLVAGTSHFVVVQLVAVGAVSVVAFLLASPARQEAAQKVALWALACAAASVVLLPWYAEILKSMASATTHASSFSWLSYSSYEFVFRENLGLGLGYAVVGAICTLAPIGGPRTRTLRPLLLGLVWGPYLLFVLTGEIRHFELVQIGLILSLSVLVSEADLAVREFVSSSGRVPGWLNIAPPAILTAFLLSTAFTGWERLQDATIWYRTVDSPAQAALDFIRDETPSDATVLAGTSPHGLPYGWWVEGYARRRTFLHVDRNLLLFKAERNEADFVDNLVSASISSPELSQMLAESGITYILTTPDRNEFANLLDRVHFVEEFNDSGFGVIRIEQVKTSADGQR